MPPAPKMGAAVAAGSAAYDQSKRPSPPATSSSTALPDSSSGGSSSASANMGTDVNDPGNVEPPDAAERYKELFHLQ